MGAGASTKKISVDAEPEGTQENDAQAAGEAGGALAEVGALLAAYQIESPEDLMRMDAKYHSLKATGAHGFGLLQGLHAELHNIHREKEGKMSLADVVAQARERVSLLMRQVTDESFNNFMCCVDGSPQSDVAYEVCLQELTSSKDGLIALHAYDSTKNDPQLNAKLKPEARKQRFDVDLMARSNKGRYKLMWMNKNGVKTKDFLLTKVNDMVKRRPYLEQSEKVSYMVTGLTGRKGGGTRSAKKVGSLTLLASGQFHLPNIIIKAKSPILGRPRIFMAAIKDLEHVVPYDLALDLMKPGNGDKLIVLHGYQEKVSRTLKDDLAKFEKYFGDRLAADGLVRNGSKFVAVPQKAGMHMHDLVIEAVDENLADYLVVYPSVSHGRENSKHMMALIEGADANIVVCNR